MKRTWSTTAIACVLAIGMTGAAEAGSEPGKRDRLFRWMVGSYVALQATDVYLTQRGAQMDLVETNPVFTSGDSVVAAKVVMVPVTVYGLTKLHRTHPKLATGLAIGLNALYAGVAASNLRVIDSE